MPSKLRQLAPRILALGLSIGVSLALAEIAVRIVRPQKTYSILLQWLGAHYALSPFNPFTLKKNYVGLAPVMDEPGVWVKTSTNSLGLRSREISERKPAGTRRVLVLGDSYTFGVFVGDEQTYSAVTERILEERGFPAEVVNCGYAAGWETDEHYNWLMRRGLDLDPDVVVLGFFVGNDITNLKTEQWVDLDDRGLPRKIVDPTIYLDSVGRLRSTTKNDYKTVGDELIYRIPVARESHFLVLLGRTLEGWFERTTGDLPYDPFEDGSHSHIFKARDDEQDDGFARQEAIFLELVQAMSEELAARDIEFLVVMIAYNFQYDQRSFLHVVFPNQRSNIVTGKFRIRRNYFEDLKPKLDAMGIQHIDTLERMLARPRQYYPRNGEVHFNATGHAFVAELIAERLIDNGWVSP